MLAAPADARPLARPPALHHQLPGCGAKPRGSASTLVMVSLRRRLPALRRTKPAAPEPAANSATPDEEALLPRWLRPSVRAARVASLKIPGPHPERRAPVRFATPVDEAADRLAVRYDRVQLLDRPDDALGMPRGELDTGDEVEVIERDAIWAHVRTPTQRDGWVPAMTLAAADPLADERAAEAEPDVDRGAAEDDLPALEALLAIAAERRALMSAERPAPPDQPRKPAKATHPSKAAKNRKTNRPTSARKKKRR